MFVTRFNSSSTEKEIIRTWCNHDMIDKHVEPICGTIQEARQKNGGISTETKPWSFLWKFDRKFHGFVSEEFPVEFQQKAPRFSLCGNSIESSTVLCRAFWILPNMQNQQGKELTSRSGVSSVISSGSGSCSRASLRGHHTLPIVLMLFTLTWSYKC